MTPSEEKRLEPHEVLRVMDAAQVIHERQEALQAHETFDREAAIRDIQVMYEELGDLVDRVVIEKALDEYLSQRYAFTPPPPGMKRRLALLYIRRGMIARRVLLPVGGLAALVWLGSVGAGVLENRAWEREVETFRREVAALGAGHTTIADDREALIAGGTPPDLLPAEAEAIAASLAEAGRRLATVTEVLAPVEQAAARDDLTPVSLGDLRAEAGRADEHLSGAREEIDGAGTLIARHTRLGTFEADFRRLHAAVLESAVEDLALERAAELMRTAEAQLAGRDVDGLGETTRRYEELHDLIVAEYEIVVTGGVWRSFNDDPNVRNYYLLVRALDNDGLRVPFTIRSEEYGTTARVLGWGERVPKGTYDRVGADKQDNGIIDDEHFGFKRRGFVSIERRYEDIGQITEW